MRTCTTEPADLADLPLQRTTAPASAPAGRTTALAREHAVARYGPLHGEGLVADCFDAAVAAYRDARVTTFVPVLVERRLREVLQQG